MDKNVGEVTGVPSGVLELTSVEIEAIRGLTLAQQALDARKRVTVDAVLRAHGCPKGATLAIQNLETGEATWTHPRGAEVVP